MKSRVGRGDVPTKRRLESWKEVAAFFGRTDRTVKRWETERGLPIHRPPGAGKGRIYAEVDELEAWLKGGAGADAREEALEARAAAAAAPLGNPWKPGRRWWVAVPVLALSAVVVIAAAWTASRHPSASVTRASSDPPLAAQRLYVSGMDNWEQRTPAGLNRAVGAFRAAIALYPRYAQAYAGLADCYDLMREYTLMPATQSYALARAAAEHALALDERVAGAHAALAFADYFGFWDAAGARAHFQRALALDPNDATTRHWYATFLLSVGETAGALQQIDAARALDPASLSIRADRDEILGGSDPAAALADLRRMARDDPKFLSPHVYLANHAENDGDDREFLKEAGIAAAMSGNTLRQAVLAAASHGYATGGHRGMLRAMLDAQTRQFEAGTGDALDLARLAALLGDRKTALADLSLASDRGEADFSQKALDRPFAFLAADPDYRRLVAHLRPRGSG